MNLYFMYVCMADRLNSAVTPLLATPYTKQLEMKEKNMSEFLKKLAKRIMHKDSNPVIEKFISIVYKQE